MQFWFCETCGKRLTDKDLEEGAARNKKLKGIFCAQCSVGVLTMEMDAVSVEQVSNVRDSQRTLQPVNSGETHRPNRTASKRQPQVAKPAARADRLPVMIA